jgi:hypothetical protein
MRGVVLGVAVSVVGLLVSSAVAYRVVGLLPADTLEARDQPLLPGHGWLRPLGLLLVLAGGVMALPGVPGQGLLTVCVGLVMLDLPWLRGPLRRLLARPAVLSLLNRLRQRQGRPALGELS